MDSLIIGDLQLHAPKEFDNLDGTNFLLEQQAKTLSWIFRFGATNKVQLYVFLGDIHTAKDRIANRVKNKLLELFEEHHVGSRTIVLAGNHDKNGEAIKYLSPYAELVTEPTVDRSSVFVPYCKDVSNIEEFLKANLKENSKTVFGHWFIEGHTPPNSTGVSLSLLSRFRQVICGHQHSFLKITERICYLGSIYQEDFAEAGQKKYIALIKDGKTKLITLPLFINRVVYRIETTSDVEKIKISFPNTANIVKLKVASGVKSALVNELQNWLKQRGCYVFKEFLPTDFNQNRLLPVTKRGQSAVVDNLFEQILKGKNIGERYFMKRAIEKVKEKVRGEA